MKVRICNKCNEEKPINEFYQNSNGRPYLFCKKCKNSTRNSKWDAVQQNSFLKRTYGITLKHKQEMYINQNGECAICKQPVSFNKICVDHCHENGVIRQLLCNRCNLFLGFLENLDTDLQNYLDYLDSF